MSPGQARRRCTKIGVCSGSTAGQALVELVLIFPLIIACFSIVVDLSRYMSVRLALETAARDAAQYAVVRDPVTGLTPKDGMVVSRATQTVPAWVGPVSVSSDVNATVGTDPAVRVQLVSSQRAFFPLPVLFPDPFVVSVSAWYPR